MYPCFTIFFIYLGDLVSSSIPNNSVVFVDFEERMEEINVAIQLGSDDSIFCSESFTKSDELDSNQFE